MGWVDELKKGGCRVCREDGIESVKRRAARVVLCRMRGRGVVMMCGHSRYEKGVLGWGLVAPP